MICAYQRDIPLWTEAIEAKYYGKGAPYERKEFDKLIGDFDVRDLQMISIESITI